MFQFQLLSSGMWVTTALCTKSFGVLCVGFNIHYLSWKYLCWGIPGSICPLIKTPMSFAFLFIAPLWAFQARISKGLFHFWLPVFSLMGCNLHDFFSLLVTFCVGAGTVTSKLELLKHSLLVPFCNFSYKTLIQSLLTHSSQIWGRKRWGHKTLAERTH